MKISDLNEARVKLEFYVKEAMKQGIQFPEFAVRSELGGSFFKVLNTWFEGKDLEISDLSVLTTGSFSRACDVMNHMKIDSDSKPVATAYVCAEDMELTAVLYKSEGDLKFLFEWTVEDLEAEYGEDDAPYQTYGNNVEDLEEAFNFYIEKMEKFLGRT